MTMRPSILQFRRATIERRIEELIALLDLLDGDENLEPYLADTDPGAGDREVDHAEHGLADRDALELFIADGGIVDNLRFDGYGKAIARKMLCTIPATRRRTRA